MLRLHEFTDKMRLALDRFIKEWETNHIADPENWPLAMKEGEWYEQFLAWSDTVGQKR